MNNDKLCIECKRPAEHDHHVVPVSYGGTVTVPLCAVCHAKVHESMSLAAISKAALDEKKDRGEWVGGNPYGYKFNSLTQCLEYEPKEQKNIQRLKELRGTGASIKHLVRLATAEGLLNRRGNPLDETIIKTLMSRDEAKYEAFLKKE